MLSKTKAYVKSYDGQAKWMFILIENDDLLEKYNTIWDKVSAYTKKKKFIKNLFRIKKISKPK